MRGFFLSKLAKRVGKQPMRWTLRNPHGDEKKALKSFLDYVGDEPFWFDGGNDGNVDAPVFLRGANGRRTQFFLPHCNVFAPSLILHVNSEVEPFWELNEAMGLVTFKRPPPERAKITARYHCKFKCVAVRKNNGKIEIREVNLRRNRLGRVGDPAGARRILADFLNFQLGTPVEWGSSLFWLFFESKDPVEIEILQSRLVEALEPIIDPKPAHDGRASRYLQPITEGDWFQESLKTPLKSNLERLVRFALRDGKFQRLRRCRSCKRFFVTTHAHTRVCSAGCETERDRQQHALRQQRYNRKQKLWKWEDDKIKSEEDQVGLFKYFMEKVGGTLKEQLQLGSVINKVPGRWKTITKWEAQYKTGIGYEQIWRGLPGKVQSDLEQELRNLTGDLSRVQRG
jgi:hypothetical protein